MIKTIATWLKHAAVILALSVSGFAPVAMQAQAPVSQATNAVFPAQIFTATSQTGTIIQLGQAGGSGNSYSVGNLSVTGVALSTATFSVYGSSDGGVQYSLLNVSPVAAPNTTVTSTTVTTNGLYQVTITGMTQIKIQTSGTFTATSLSIVFTAAPYGIISRNNSGGTPGGAAGGVLSGTYPNPGFAIPVNANSTISSAIVGPELTTNGTFSTSLTGWTDSGTNWASATPGAQHSTGAADTLSQTISVTNGNTYQLTFTLSGISTGSVGFTVGSATIFLDGTSSTFVSNQAYINSFVAAGGGAIVITPTSTFNGTITNFSIKQVTVGSATPSFEALNSDGSLGVPFYSGGIGLRNTFIGQQVGFSNSLGSKNVGLGAFAFASNVAGYSDVAVGDSALNLNTMGYQDTAVGASALGTNTTGAGNAAFGFQALALNTQGFDDNAFGEFSLQANTTGANNVAMGESSLKSNTTGIGNTGLGQSALSLNTTGTANTAVGLGAGEPSVTNANITGTENTWIGYQAGPNTTTQLVNSTCVGYQCQSSANNQVTLGNSSVTSVVTNGAETNTSIGTSTYSGPLLAPAYELTTLTRGNSQPFFDDYYALGTYGTAVSQIVGSTGACSTIVSTFLDANHPGNLVVTSGTSGAGTGGGCSPDSGVDTIISPNSIVPFVWEAVVLVPVLPGTTAGTYQAGMTHTVAASPWTASNGMFYLSSANGVANDWYCGIGSASLSFTDSTVLAVVSTWTRLTLVWDGTLMHWYINGVQVCGTGTAGVTGLSMVPTAFTSVSSSGTSLSFAADYAYFYRALTR